MRFGEPARTFPAHRGVRQNRGADTLLHHQADRLVIIEFGLDLELNAATGKQRLHRRAQPVSENERGGRSARRATRSPAVVPRVW